MTVAGVAATLSGCTAAGSAAGSAPAATPSSATPSGAAAGALQPDDTCPSPGAPAPQWPQAVPASLPKPPGSQIHATRVIGAATYVSFTTPTSLRDSTLYLVGALRTAGYTISRGDAEATEADAPFTGPTVVGAIRLTLTASCVTTWTLAVEPRLEATAVTPTLIPYHPGASASPLPFG